MRRILPALHGIAIVAVILNHSISLCLYTDERLGIQLPVGLEYQAMIFLKSIGLIAVPIFLFSSGSFIVYSTFGKNLRSSYTIVFARLKRLIVPYVILSVVFYALLYILEGKVFSIPGYVKNLLVGYPYHFVPLLFFFYIIAPLLIIACRKKPILVLAVVGIYQLLLYNNHNPGSIGFASPQWIALITPPVIGTTFADWGIFFPLGIIFILYSQMLLALAQKIQKLLIPGVTILFVALILSEVAIINLAVTRLLFPFFSIPLMITWTRESIPFAGFLERFGKRSYGLYLLNMIVINVVIVTIVTIIPAIIHLQLLLSLVTFTLAILVFWLIVEGIGRFKLPKVSQYVFG